LRISRRLRGIPIAIYRRGVEVEVMWKTIVKSERDWNVIPNLRNYAETYASFSWQDARSELDGSVVYPNSKGWTTDQADATDQS
jgi:hypothetical protein